MGTVLLVAVVVLAILAIGIYNSLIRLKKRMENAWAQIDVQLKRRYDLIPNLVEVTKGYAKHEKELFEQIAQARTRYFQASSVAEKAEAAGGFERALSRLLMLQERYPQLKANETFLKLQDSLEGTENRIAVERKRYNDAVRALNTYRRTVFGRFFAALAGVGPAEYFEIPAEEQRAPKVTF